MKKFVLVLLLLAGTLTTFSYAQQIHSGNATALQGRAIMPTLPTEGQVLKYTSGKWTPGSTTGTGDVLGPATNSDNYIPQWNGINSKTLKNGVVAPAGALVGTTDTQTLTGKTISGASNTITNIAEVSFAFTDVTTANASTSAHGLCPKLPGGTSNFWREDGSFQPISEATFAFTDITTADASVTKHGLCPKLSGVATEFYNGTGGFSTPAGGGDVTGPAASVDSEIALFSSTSGKLLKRATQTGFPLLTSGVMSALTDTPNCVLGRDNAGTRGCFTTLYLNVPWESGTSTPPVDEGRAYWRTDEDNLYIGSGAVAYRLLSTKNTIAVGEGGTGKASWTNYSIPYLLNSATFGEIGIGTAGQYLKVNPSATGYVWDTVAGGGDVLGPATHAANYIPKWNGTPNSKTLVEGVAAPTSAIVGVSDAQTLTGKTLDVEGSGNIITIPVKVWLAAAGCNNTTAATFWDLPTSNAAAAACTTGTNTQKGVLDFVDGANSISAQTHFMLPSDFSSAGNLDVVIKWFSSVITGDVVWQVATSCVADAETDDPAWNTSSTVTDTTKGTTLQVNDATITDVVKTGCAAGELLHLKIFRDPAHASDSMLGTARLIGVEVTYRRSM